MEAAFAVSSHLASLNVLKRWFSTAPSLRLCDYFDYIAGTSTGAIIAAGLARGMKVAEIIEFYRSSGKQMFEPAALVQRLKSFYTADPLKHEAAGFRRPGYNSRF